MLQLFNALCHDQSQIFGPHQYSFFSRFGLGPVDVSQDTSIWKTVWMRRICGPPLERVKRVLKDTLLKKDQQGGRTGEIRKRRVQSGFFLDST